MRSSFLHLGTVVLMVIAVLAGPALAGAAEEPASGSLSSRVAAALEKSPVVVYPPYDSVIGAAAQRRLVRKIKATGRPILMALVPLVAGDQFNGEARPFVATLQDRMARDAIYVAVDDRYLRVFEHKAGEDVYEGPVTDAETLANYAGPSSEAYKRTLLERAELFLTKLQLPAAELKRQVAAYEKGRDRPRDTSLVADRGAGRDSDRSMLLPVLFVIALAAVGVAVLVRRRRRSGARPAADALPVLPDRVFEHARAAQRGNLREDADQELLALSALLDEQPMPQKPAAQDAYQRALDAYAAARRRSGPEAPTVDLVGALVLTDHARSDLASAAAIDAGRRATKRPALCVFDPLHGRAARQVKWEHRGRTLSVPACSACAAAVRRGDAPDVLRDGDRPYFEGDTVWARTGFGSFDDDLVERVARGE